MTTLESHILDSVAKYEQESGRMLPPSSFYKSIVLDIQRKYKESKNGNQKSLSKTYPA